MAKKAKSKTKRPQSQPAVVATRKTDKDAAVSKQTAGGVTGAVLGGMVAGPLGAIAGGVTGAMIGDESAKGKRPIKRAVEAIRTEIREGGVKDALKSVTERVTARLKSLRTGRKKAAAPKAASKSKKAKSKPAKKKTKSAKKSKAATARKKKRAKKKS
jgi:hypothetical protein